MKNPSTETVKIRACLNLIETKLAWGDSDKWNTQDFEKLSALIEDDTSVLLSVTTLKRIWGKIKYDSSPNVKTLDALTQFAGEGSWREFNQESITVEQKNIDHLSRKRGINPLRIGLGSQFIRIRKSGCIQRFSQLCCI